MDKKLLFFFILYLNYTNIHASENNHHSGVRSATGIVVGQSYNMDFSLSQNDLQEIDSTATGNPISITPTSVASVNSLHNDGKTVQTLDDKKDEDRFDISVLCCLCCKIKLLEFKKSDCSSCCCCCSESVRRSFFSCCMM